MKLNITDHKGNIIKEDEIIVEKNDILIIQITNPNIKNREKLLEISKNIQENLKQIFKPTADTNFTPKALFLSSDFTLKVLKVRNEE